MDTGLLMDAVVHSADMQDRDGGVLLMATLFGLYPFLLKLYADAGYQGPKLDTSKNLPSGNFTLSKIRNLPEDGSVTEGFLEVSSFRKVWPGSAAR